MFAKKTICTLSAGAMLATAVPVLADSSRWDHDGYRGHRAHERVAHGLVAHLCRPDAVLLPEAVDADREVTHAYTTSAKVRSTRRK